MNFCKCGHAEGDHARNAEECLEDDCECVCFTIAKQPKNGRRRPFTAVERRVLEKIVRSYGLAVDDVLSTSRHPRVVRARDHAIAVFRWSLWLSYPELGALFFRDHTTIMQAEFRHEMILNGEALGKRGIFWSPPAATAYYRSRGLK